MRHLLTIVVLLHVTSFGYAVPTQPDDPADELLRPEQAPERMDNARLEKLLQRLGGELSGETGSWQIRFGGIPAYVVTDESADRMRIMVAIAPTEGMERALLYRLLQANFESALDARYAVAQDHVWSVFIHPLSPLTEDEFVSALAQTYNAAETFGTSFSSGRFSFGGGDNRGELYDEVIERGQRL